MQQVVELTGKHWKQSARVFVERPEPGIKAGKRTAQSPYCTVKQVPGGTVFRGESIVINSPTCPNKAVKDVSRRPNNILLKPSATSLIDVCYSTIGNPHFERGECPVRDF